jgi:polyhydroxyalkanoate synthase
MIEDRLAGIERMLTAGTSAVAPTDGVTAAAMRPPRTKQPASVTGRDGSGRRESRHMTGPGAAPVGIGIETRVREEVERALLRQRRGSSTCRPGPRRWTDAEGRRVRPRTLRLSYHYRPLAPEVYRVPVLLVMSLVSKAYILDLTPGQSFIEFLLRQGYDVYMIDWGVPRPADKRLRLEDYVLDFIPDCLERIRRDSGEPDLSMIGYCMGGLLAVLYEALHPDGPVKNLACFTTPVNFEAMTLFSQWTDKRYFDVDRVVDSLGNVPPELMYASFEMLKPAARLAGQVRLWDNMWNDDFVKGYRMFDRWAADQIPFPGECFRQTVKELMWENRLYKNELVLGGRPVKLERITVPFLPVMIEQDDMVPAPADTILGGVVVSADKRSPAQGGHVSLVAAQCQPAAWPQLDTWLGALGMSARERAYPRKVSLGGEMVTLRPMNGMDRAALLAFSRALPGHDLLFLPVDITRPAVIDAWVDAIERGAVTTLLADRDGVVQGYAAVDRGQLDWSPHVAELRVLVAGTMRGKGLGRLLTQEAFALALELGIEKMVAQMTVDQKGAIACSTGVSAGGAPAGPRQGPRGEEARSAGPEP